MNIAYRSRRIALTLLFPLAGLFATACSSSTTHAAPTPATPSPTTSATGGHHHAGVGVVGVITTMQATQLQLKTHVSSETLLLTSSTTYHQGHHTIAASALSTGQRVRVEMVPGATAPTAKKVTVLPNSYAGTVSAVTSTGFQLRLADGTTRTVTTTGATVYRSGTTKTTAAALKSGDTVRLLAQPRPGGSLSTSQVSIKAG